MIFKRIQRRLKAHGVLGLSGAVFHRILPRRLAGYSQCKPFFEDKSGLEIGGPSEIFSRVGLIPVYPIAAHIDNCNFSSHTTWEGNIIEGNTFKFHKRRPAGKQYVVEASDLSRIASDGYDFVLSSHVLEHTANPLKALSEWIRVLKPSGLFVLVVPHKDSTFDHLRPVTRLEHLLQDFERQTTEADMTHLEEILKLHDLAKDPKAGDLEAFKERSKKNLENRCLHHHVFDTRLVVEILHHMGLQMLLVEPSLPCHVVVMAQKPSSSEQVQNDRFRTIHEGSCWSSPFPTDRLAIQGR